MDTDTFKITKKNKVKGDDGYKTFSIRIKEETVAALDEWAEKSNRSRNELINIILERDVKNIEIVESEKKERDNAPSD
ncbi:MAG: ribbon-helix-helix domain-containing protein [Synergistaceae bacterium]|nr:ribbon-helix-helix domain-containing protein [Synergistaceae bacterium]